MKRRIGLTNPETRELEELRDLYHRLLRKNAELTDKNTELHNTIVHLLFLGDKKPGNKAK